MKIGIFGGAFDPPHMAHVWLAGWALSACNLDKLLIVPCWGHAFGKQMSPYNARMEMCRRAFSIYDESRVQVSALEASLKSQYTVDLLRALKLHSRPEEELVLFVGADEYASLMRGEWHESKAILEMVSVQVMGRLGTTQSTIAPALPSISSTQIRQYIRVGATPWGQVPSNVLDYLKDQGLYLDPPDPNH